MATAQSYQGKAESGAKALEARGGKYLTFHLAAEEYGLEILKVREIIGLMKITRIPRTPPYIRGVINLRGKVIPVLDLRLRFGMDATPDTEQTCVIVVDMSTVAGSMMMGVVVDAVSEVQNINQDQIEAAPMIGSHADTTFILGIAKIKNEVKILLDIDKVLTNADFSTLESIAASKTEEPALV
jgi:purine-binding chemotaxis protein CheW